MAVSSNNNQQAVLIHGINWQALHDAVYEMPIELNFYGRGHVILPCSGDRYVFRKVKVTECPVNAIRRNDALRMGLDIQEGPAVPTALTAKILTDFVIFDFAMDTNDGASPLIITNLKIYLVDDDLVPDFDCQLLLGTEIIDRFYIEKLDTMTPEAKDERGNFFLLERAVRRWSEMANVKWDFEGPLQLPLSAEAARARVLEEGDSDIEDVPRISRNDTRTTDIRSDRGDDNDDFKYTELRKSLSRFLQQINIFQAVTKSQAAARAQGWCVLNLHTQAAATLLSIQIEVVLPTQTPAVIPIQNITTHPRRGPGPYGDALLWELGELCYNPITRVYGYNQAPTTRSVLGLRYNRSPNNFTKRATAARRAQVTRYGQARAQKHMCLTRYETRPDPRGVLWRDGDPVSP